jgi:filamentous hemagglutinin family protein
VRTGLQTTAAVFLLGLCLAGNVCAALPVGPTVVNGQVTFGNSLVTNTSGAIVNWQSFGIGKDEVTRYIQQSAASTALNRVIGGNPSQILGALQSNSSVFLINPAGTVFPTQVLIEANDGAVSDSPGGSLTLAPGKSMTLADPKSPDLKFQVTAPQNRAVDVGQLMGTIGNKGVASVLTNRTGNTNANSAIVGDNGNIILRSVP